MRKIVACCSLAGLMACSNAPPPAAAPNETRAGMASQNDLVTSIEVEVGADTVRFVLHLTNSTAGPIRLEFPSAQRYDFVVRTPANAEVWRWSADQMFAQMISEESIPAGGSRQFMATWQPGSRTGAFVAEGRVTARNRAIEQRSAFEIQKR